MINKTLTLPKPTIMRSRPTQARSQATFERILHTALNLLHEIGYEGFNTNLLAKRADCRVSTIYRYFPDKNAIILVLADDMAREWRQWLTGFDDEVDANGDLVSTWGRYFDRFFENIRQQTAALTIRQALQASPELQAAYRAEVDAYTADVAETLTRHAARLDDAAARAAAFVLISSTLPVLDQASMTPAGDLTARIGALRDMHLTYLRHLLSSATTPGPTRNG